MNSLHECGQLLHYITLHKRGSDCNHSGIINNFLKFQSINPARVIDDCLELLSVTNIVTVIIAFPHSSPDRCSRSWQTPHQEHADNPPVTQVCLPNSSSVCNLFDSIVFIMMIGDNN